MLTAGNISVQDKFPLGQLSLSYLVARPWGCICGGWIKTAKTKHIQHNSSLQQGEEDKEPTRAEHVSEITD